MASVAASDKLTQVHPLTPGTANEKVDPTDWTDAEWECYVRWIPPSTRIELHQHLAFRCLVCQQCYRDFSETKRHVLAVHLDWRPYPCPLCSQRFRTPSKLALHQRTHTGEQPFKCITCNKRFVYRAGLSQHIKDVHTIERKYECHCGQAFVRLSSLESHQLTHENRRKFECSVCHCRFRRKSHAQRHVDSLEAGACEKYLIRQDAQRKRQRAASQTVDSKKEGVVKTDIDDSADVKLDGESVLTRSNPVKTKRHKMDAVNVEFRSQLLTIAKGK